MKTTVTLQLSDELHQQFKDYALRREISVSAAMRIALVDFIDKVKPAKSEPAKPEPTKPKAKPMSDTEWVQSQTMQRKPVEITDEDLQRVREVWGD